MTSPIHSKFPPELIKGNRVWTIQGFSNHGPIEGPKINIESNMGGTIIATEKIYSSIDQLLYMIRWDNEQVSKHYSKDLFCIGRFKTRSDFEASIRPQGEVQLTIGPKGGFRQAALSLEYDEHVQEAVIFDRRLWLECLEPIVKRSNVKITIITLPTAPRIRKNRKLF